MLAQATRRFAATRHPGVVVSHKDLSPNPITVLEGVTEQCVREISFLDLFTHPKAVKDLELKTADRAKASLHELGFLLSRCLIEAEGIEPSRQALARTPGLWEAWTKYQQTREQQEIEDTERKNAFELRKLNEQKKFDLAKTKRDNDHICQVETENNKRDIEKRKLALQDEQEKGKPAEALASIKTDEAKINDQVLREKMRLENDRKEYERQEEQSREEAKGPLHGRGRRTTASILD